MTERPIAVAGHCCVDIIPTFDAAGTSTDASVEAFVGRAAATLTPGRLTHVGPARFATGGLAPNVGLALHRLGVEPRLLGKVGDDLLGDVLLNLLRQVAPALTDQMIVAPGEPTSYSIVINPPGVDRLFLHCPGVNDTYAAADVAAAQLEGVRLLHFGYPPLMRRMYQNSGQEVVTLLQQARRQGVTTSLDMALPDPDSEAGHVDWTAFLAHVLPQVNLFMPSAEELLFMLDRPLFERWRASASSGSSVVSQMDGDLLSQLAEQCLALGAMMVALKLGNQGLYLRTTERGLAALWQGFTDDDDLEEWRGRELLAPCYQAHVVGTTGSGDATIAGLLTSLLYGSRPETALHEAVAVGACSVEAADATSAVPTWDHVRRRMANGWPQHAVALDLPGWRWVADAGCDGLWYGPNDHNEVHTGAS